MRPDPRTAGLSALLLIVALTVSLLLGELALRLLTPFPISEESNVHAHPDLLYTADPAFPEIDPNGFRNPAPLRARYDVVAIGDSHTYGSNASSSETWPARFAQSTGLATYNMGMGGYSIYQYDVLFDMAVALRPRWILLALYPANDWMPDCALLRLPAWSNRATREGLEPPCDPTADAVPAAMRPSLRSFAARTAVGSAVRTLLLEPLRFVWLPRLGVRAAAGPELVVFPVGGREFTFGMSRLLNHSRGTDLASPRIAAAYEDGRRLLRRWRDGARTEGIAFAVAIIPSKEVVLRSWATDYGHAVPEELDRLTQNELAATRVLLGDLQEMRIPAVDALPFVAARFEQTVRAGEDMYPPGLDGHPYPSGYGAYAAAIVSLIRAHDEARTQPLR